MRDEGKEEEDEEEEKGEAGKRLGTPLGPSGMTDWAPSLTLDHILRCPI